MTRMYDRERNAEPSDRKRDAELATGVPPLDPGRAADPGPEPEVRPA